MKIVIVEDEVRIREGIHRLLTKTDPSFEVVGEAENGREGIELLLWNGQTWRWWTCACRSWMASACLRPSKRRVSSPWSSS